MCVRYQLHTSPSESLNSSTSPNGSASESDSTSPNGSSVSPSDTKPPGAGVLNEFDSTTAVPAARKGFIACVAEDAAAAAVTGVWFSSTANAAEGDASDAGVASESTFVKGVATSEGAETGTGGVPVGMFGAGVSSPNAANAAEGEYPPGVASCTTGITFEGGAAGNDDCPGVGNGEVCVGKGSGVRIGGGVGAGVQRG